MGRKVHPYGFRLGVSRTWTAKWYADKEYTSLVKEDISIRQLVERRLANASVSGVEIERGINHVTVTIHRQSASDATLVFGVVFLTAISHEIAPDPVKSLERVSMVFGNVTLTADGATACWNQVTNTSSCP